MPGPAARQRREELEILAFSGCTLLKVPSAALHLCVLKLAEGNPTDRISEGNPFPIRGIYSQYLLIFYSRFPPPQDPLSLQDFRNLVVSEMAFGEIPGVFCQDLPPSPSLPWSWHFTTFSGRCPWAVAAKGQLGQVPAQPRLPPVPAGVSPAAETAPSAGKFSFFSPNL